MQLWPCFALVGTASRTSRASQRRESVSVAVGCQWPGVAALIVSRVLMRLLSFTFLCLSLLVGCAHSPSSAWPKIELAAGVEWMPSALPLIPSTLQRLGLTLEQTRLCTSKVLLAVKARGTDYDPSKPFLYAISPCEGRGGTLWVMVPIRSGGAEAHGVSLRSGEATFGYSAPPENRL